MGKPYDDKAAEPPVSASQSRRSRSTASSRTSVRLQKSKVGAHTGMPST